MTIEILFCMVQHEISIHLGSIQVIVQCNLRHRM